MTNISTIPAITPSITSSMLPTTTTPTSSTSQTGSNSSAANATNALASMTSSEFLQLLVAQLQNQNPLNPTDPSTFVAQTAQLTMVQALQGIQTVTDQTNQETGIMSATSMIGKTVTGSLADGTPVTGLVSSVSVSSNGPSLNIAGSAVPISSITSVSS